MSYAIQSWPAWLMPETVRLYLQAHTGRFESPWTRTVQTQVLPGARFMLSLSLPPRVGDDVRKARAWFAGLRGSAGWFYFRAEPELGAYPIPAAGAAEPTGLVPLTADFEGITVDSTRITADATVRPDRALAVAVANTDPAVLLASSSDYTGAVAALAGMHISFDDADGWRHLHVLTEDAVVLGSGIVRFVVQPALRAFPAVGAPIHTRFPSGVFQLADDDQGAQTAQSWRMATEMVVDAVEARPMQLP